MIKHTDKVLVSMLGMLYGIQNATAPLENCLALFKYKVKHVLAI